MPTSAIHTFAHTALYLSTIRKINTLIEINVAAIVFQSDTENNPAVFSRYIVDDFD
jgi:hypothetical protein